MRPKFDNCCMMRFVGKARARDRVCMQIMQADVVKDEVRDKMREVSASPSLK